MNYRLKSLSLVSALVAPALASSCMSLNAPERSSDVDVGAVGFNLTMTSDTQSKDLNYKITGTSNFERSGDIPFAADTRSFSALITGIPVGTGYQMALATGADAKVPCMGSAGFDIAMPGVTEHLSVQLRCRHALPETMMDAGQPQPPNDADAGMGPGPDDPGTGSVNVGGETNLCPDIDGLYTWRELDGSIELSSSACDPDSMPAHLSYKWKVSGGELTATDGEIVHFFCPAEGGSVQVTLEVSDSLCAATFSQQVDCKCADDKKQGGDHSGDNSGEHSGDDSDDTQSDDNSNDDKKSDDNAGHHKYPWQQ